MVGIIYKFSTCSVRNVIETENSVVYYEYRWSQCAKIGDVLCNFGLYGVGPLYNALNFEL